MTLKNDVETSVEQNIKITEKSMNEINDSLILTLEQKKKEEQHQRYLDIILSSWLALMFKDFENDLYRSAQNGIDEADKQLKAKNLFDEEKKNKNMTAELYNKQVESRLDSVRSDLLTVAEEVKSNSSAIMRTVNEQMTVEQQKKMADELLQILKANGITFFYDKAGRRWKIENYVKMRTMTELIQGERLAFFTRATQFKVDLVKIIHLNIHPECQLCAPFNNKILSINGSTPGYMTLDQAAMQGLFHPNCDHVPEQFELAPIDNGSDGIIELNEENKKRFEYNKKKNKKFFS